jgi:hypothetical protein
MKLKNRILKLIPRTIDDVFACVVIIFIGTFFASMIYFTVRTGDTRECKSYEIAEIGACIDGVCRLRLMDGQIINTETLYVTGETANVCKYPEESDE